MKKLFDLDFIGMAASVLCLIHCLALPWLIALAGTYLGSYVESPYFHTFMLVLAIAIGLPVFIVSFMKYKSKSILFTGVMGLALTTFGTMQEDSCCPPVSTANVESCKTAGCETACESTMAGAKIERYETPGCETADCETACESTVAGAKIEKYEAPDCETECSASAKIVTEAAKTIDISEPTLLQGFNTVPLGVTLILLAHFLNFRKKRSCARACCK